MTVTPPNPIGIHSLVWVGDTSPESLATAIAGTRDTGYDLLEITLHDSVDLDADRAREHLTQAGLAVACSRGLALDADVSATDPAVVRRGADLLHDSLLVTHALGGRILTGGLYSAFAKFGHPLSASGRANVVSVLRELAKDATQLDVQLGLEVCNRYETNVINTARDALRLADDIGADNIRIHLDSYHMNIEETDFAGPVREVGDRLGYVHVGENHRGYLGSGHIDFDQFFHALADIDYTGPITFESFSSAVVSPKLSSDLAVWRDLWSDGMDLARSARAFIADRLVASNASRSSAIRRDQ